MIDYNYNSWFLLFCLIQTTVELRNMTAASRHVRVIPPTTPHFSIGLGKYKTVSQQHYTEIKEHLVLTFHLA